MDLPVMVSRSSPVIFSWNWNVHSHFSSVSNVVFGFWMDGAPNQLTLWSWALLERPLDVRPLDSFPAFHGTRKFSTEFTRALHLFLSLARPIQSTSPHLTSPRSILILYTHLRLGLPGGLFPCPCPHSMARPRVADVGTASRYGG
jgi:hypothetical protein